MSSTPKSPLLKRLKLSSQLRLDETNLTYASSNKWRKRKIMSGSFYRFQCLKMKKKNLILKKISTDVLVWVKCWVHLSVFSEPVSHIFWVPLVRFCHSRQFCVIYGFKSNILISLEMVFTQLVVGRPGRLFGCSIVIKVIWHVRTIMSDYPEFYSYSSSKVTLPEHHSIFISVVVRLTFIRFRVIY